MNKKRWKIFFELKVKELLGFFLGFLKAGLFVGVLFIVVVYAGKFLFWFTDWLNEVITPEMDFYFKVIFSAFIVIVATLFFAWLIFNWIRDNWKEAGRLAKRRK